MFDPRGFNDVAKGIKGLGAVSAEARARSMAGRSYYCLFLAVRIKVLAAAKRPIDSKVERGALSNALFASTDPASAAQMQALGKLLQELYDCRQQADYRIVPTNKAGQKAQRLDVMRRMSELVADALNRLDGLDFSGAAAKLP